MKMRSLVIVPNHGMTVKANCVCLEKAEVELIEAVHRSGFRTGILALGSKNANTSIAGELSREEHNVHDISVSNSHANLLLKIVNYIYSTFKIPFVISRYDYIYAFFPGHTPLLVCLWARLLNRRYGLYVRCNWLRGDATPFLENLALKGASYIIATGMAFQKRLETYTDKILTVVPLTPLRPCESMPVRMAPKDNTRLIFVGRICESKGVLDTIRALNEIKTFYPNVSLSIAGGGTEKEKQAIEKLALDLELTECVHLLGYLSAPDLEALYHQADIMVFPSYYAEGFPRVLYEAMMYGLPIVTCPMPGTSGFLIEGVHCHYCEPRSSHDIAQKTLRILADESTARDMGRANLETVRSLYMSFKHRSHAEQLLSFLEVSDDQGDDRCAEIQ